MERVESDAGDAVPDCLFQLFSTLIVAMKIKPLGREIGRHRHRQFATGHDVHVEIFFLDNPSDRRVRERLGRVFDV